MRVVFMGTPAFAVAALEALIRAGHDVAAVVTQPDKPKGRGMQMQMTPVKECALAHGIAVFQPVRIREAEAVETLRTYGADIFVVAAFGQILSQEILALPAYGCINIHASLLPKYRGAAPIQWAIINGEDTTGVTIMQMDQGLDTGDMLLAERVPIAPDETGDSLHDKLADTGAALVVRALAAIEAGEVTPVKQNDAESCYAHRIQKSLGRLDWRQSARELDRLIRGLLSWPGAYTARQGRNLKIWEARPATPEEEARIRGENACGGDGAGGGTAAPGTVVCAAKDAVYVQTGEGLLKILALQPEGKKRMAVRDYLLGYPLQAGERLGG